MVSRYSVCPIIKPARLLWTALVLLLVLLNGCALFGTKKPEPKPWEKQIQAEKANHEAGLWLKAGEYKRAEELFQRAVTLNPGLPSAWIGLARSLNGQDKYAEAAGAFDAALALSEGTDYLLCEKGLALVMAGDMEGAISVHEKLVGKNVLSPSCWMLRGDLLMNSGRKQEAAAEYVTAVTMAPNDPEAWRRTGNAALALENSEAAVKAFTNALGLKPQDPRLYYGRARAFHMAGRAKEAGADYEKAVELDSRMPEAWYHLGRLRWESQDKAGAAAAYQKALETAVESSDPLIGETFVWYPRTDTTPPPPPFLAYPAPGPPYALAAPHVARTKPEQPEGPSLYEANTVLEIVDQPSQNARKLGELPAGVWVLGEKKANWVKLDPGGWTRAENLETPEMGGEFKKSALQWMTISQTPVRSGPSEALALVGSLPQGLRVKVLEKRNGWVRLGSVKWVRENALVRVYDPPL